MWLQSIVGISVVFLALIALSFFIFLFGKIMKDNGKKGATKEIPELEKVKEIEVSADSDDDEIIAVITAAIQAAMAKAGISPECKIVVRSFKRVVSDAPAWNAAGRKELLN